MTGSNEKRIIYWFSATGNSFVAARQLAREGGADLQPMTTASGRTDANSIGLVFPVHAFGLPIAVRDFVQRLSIWGDDAYVYAVATYGNCQGHPGKVLAALLARRGICLGASWSLRMVENYTPVLPLPKPERRERH